MKEKLAEDIMITLYTNDWSIENIDAILFDKDGTFQDDHMYWGKLAECRVNALIKHFNLDKKDFEPLCYAIGYDPNTIKLIKNGPVGTLSKTEVIEFMVNDLKKYNVETDFETVNNIFNEVHDAFTSDMAKYVSFIEHSKEFILKLHKIGVKLGIVTSDSHLHTQEVIKILGIEDCFEVVVGKDDCDQDKKTGKPALIAIEKMGLDKDKTLVIGDAPMDFQMSKNANLKGAILVSTGQVDFDDLKKLTNTVANNLSEVKIK